MGCIESKNDDERDRNRNRNRNPIIGRKDVIAWRRYAARAEQETTVAMNMNMNTSMNDMDLERKDRDYWKDLLQWMPPDNTTETTKSTTTPPNDKKVTKNTTKTSTHKTKTPKTTSTTTTVHNVDHKMHPYRNTIRIYLTCSTYSSHTKEHQILHSDALPYLRHFAHKFHLRILLSDLRYGLDDTPSNNNINVVVEEGEEFYDVCEGEVRRCREESLGACFCLLLGDVYGKRIPPGRLSIEEYNMAVKEAVRRRRKEEKDGHDGDDGDNGGGKILEVLKERYRIDNNIVPPSYVLLGKEKRRRREIVEDDPSILRNVVDFVTGTKEDDEDVEDYNDEDDEYMDESDRILAEFFETPSLVERETIAGLLSSSSNPPRTKNDVAVFRRNILDLHSAPSTYHDDATNLSPLTKFKSETERLVRETGGAFYEYTVESTDDVDMDLYVREFANDFCAWILGNVRDVVMRSLSSSPPPAGGGRRMDRSDLSNVMLEREVRSHRHHANVDDDDGLFVGREEVVSTLVDHCTKGKGAVVLRGMGGSGRSSILGQVARRLERPRVDGGGEGGGGGAEDGPTVILRFMGVTTESSGSEAVVESMQHQLSVYHPKITRETLNRVQNATMDTYTRFLRLVRALSERGERVVLILGRMDRLDSFDTGRDALEEWLPPLFGPDVLDNVAIILSGTPRSLRTVETMPHRHILDVPEFTTDEAREMLSNLLRSHSRALDETQIRTILHKFNENEKSPLFLKVAFLQSSHWKSWDHDVAVQIPDTVKGQMIQLFRQLNRDFGTNLVKSIVSHLTIARDGVDVDDLRAIASCDEAVRREVSRYYHHRGSHDNSRRSGGNSRHVVPPYPIEGILGRLEPYMTKRRMGPMESRYWNHPVFADVAEDEFLFSSDGRWRSKVYKQVARLSDQFRGFVDDGGGREDGTDDDGGGTDLLLHRLHQSIMDNQVCNSV